MERDRELLFVNQRHKALAFLSEDQTLELREFFVQTQILKQQLFIREYARDFAHTLKNRACENLNLNLYHFFL